MACTVITAAIEVRKRRRQRMRRRSCWMREIFVKRKNEGTDAILIPKLLSDSVHFRNFFRMSKDTFSYLLQLLEPQLRTRKDTKLRRCISAKERLGVTLRFLATGELYTLLILYFICISNIHLHIFLLHIKLYMNVIKI